MTPADITPTFLVDLYRDCLREAWETGCNSTGEASELAEVLAAKRIWRAALERAAGIVHACGSEYEDCAMLDRAESAIRRELEGK